MTGATLMPLTTAEQFAWALAQTLMVSIILFQTHDGQYGAVPADEFDGDHDSVIREYDPFAYGV
jgi:hypothetical protein